MEQQIYSVTQINTYIQSMMDSDRLLSGLCIRGEISNYKVYPSGHHYFSLKDATGALRCVMFKSSAIRLRFRPENGMKVVAFGRVTVFPRDGQYQLYCAELSFDELLNAKGPDPEYVPLPRFPAVTRDIAVVCDRAVTVGALEDCIRRGAKGLLKDVSLFDIYTGSGIPEGKKSVAFNLTLRSDDRSLTAQEADEDVKSILETLKAELNAVLR